MNRRPVAFLVTGLFFVLCPATAWANAGTPLMWAGVFHLLIGNLAIGFAEGWLFARWGGGPKAKAVVTMVGANYFSALIGALLIGAVDAGDIGIDLNTAPSWLGRLLVGTFAVTLVVEFPFVYSLFRSGASPLKRSLLSSLCIQSFSYAVLTACYWMAGHTSLYTSARVVDPVTLNLPKNVAIWFIHPDDGHVYRRTLGHPVAEKVFDLQSTNHNDRILTRPSATSASRRDLVARLETGDSRNPNFMLVGTNLDLVVPADRPEDLASPAYPPNTWFNFGRVPVLSGVTNRTWSYSTGFWAAGGLRVHGDSPGSSMHFAFETPFVSWIFRNAVQLPNDQLIFQLGRDQICAFDPNTRSFALLFRGRGPAIAIERPPTP